MELESKLLGCNQIKLFTREGKLLPDPNLIWNIDHLIAFIQITINSWDKHSEAVNHEIKHKAQHDSSWINFKGKSADKKLYRDTTLNQKINERVYISSIFSVATYYITTFEAMEKLHNQLKTICQLQRYNIKKPKLYKNKHFHQKIKTIRNISFIHQDSTDEKNPMNIRTAMYWTPSISFKSNEIPTTEDYIFALGKWHQTINEEKTVTNIDIKIRGFTKFADTALEILEKNKSILSDYFYKIKEFQE
ncbi:hypothetical protein [Kangiella taiwanensis]|uniref:TIGR04255 family protein n=1 Tax=Kangiella taiwanensis TaxID=1079179 RepID=A0ABP8HWK4_9GAMM|nr:hypothetical protein [Kangiella taiwanensis]